MIRQLSLILCLNLIVGCSMLSSVTTPIKDHASKKSDDLFGPGIESSNWQDDSETHTNLTNLPKAKGKIVVSTYGFKDMSGQYKPSPSSSFSTAVSQGANAILIKALKDSNWFTPIEREGLQNLLTERKIVRAGLQGTKKGIPPLTGASIILEGGIIGYDTNIKSGGAGARYFGLGASEQYRVDQVTVSLRAVDISSGKIINTVVVSKSVFSKETRTGFFRFVRFKRLLELEAGYTRNEPGQLALVDAIETAVLRMITTGLIDNLWSLADPKEFMHPVIEQYSDPKKWNNRVAVLKSWLQRIENEKQKKNQNKSIATNHNKSKQALITAPKAAHSSQNSRTKKSPTPRPNTITNTSDNTVSKTDQKVVETRQAPEIDLPKKETSTASSRSTISKAANQKPVAILNDLHDLPFEQVYSVVNRRSAKDGFYSIQLLSSTNSNDLIDFISNTKANRTAFTYATYSLNGSEKFALLYGYFPTQEEAQEAMNLLPSDLSSHRPWVRKVSKP